MLLNRSEIRGWPLLSHADGAVLGIVMDLIINPDTGRIEAFWVKPYEVPLKEAIVASEDVLGFRKGLSVRNEKVILEPGDILRVAEILNRGIFFYGNRAIGESGNPVGKVYDISFDPKQLMLRQIYTSKGFFPFYYDRRIYPYGAIVEAMPDRIIVKDLEAPKEEVINPDLLKDMSV